MDQVLAIICIVLAAIPLGMTLVNCAALARSGPALQTPSVAILIPARNEATNIRACIEACLLSEAVDATVIVGDDGSTDGTAQIVEDMARSDRRVRLVAIPPLPAGWNGKQHACSVLARTCDDRPLMLFLDADVRLKPTGIARLASRLQTGGAAMVSGVPQQILGSPWERLLIPMINTLLLGYLPVLLMRLSPSPGFGAACGQMIMVRRDAYEAAGGHAGIRGSIHDGLKLPRAFRQAGFLTDLVEGSEAATCRMYASAVEVRDGFMKNATEGMARPLALPIWTFLLLGGHVLPWFFLIVGWVRGDRTVAALAAAACAMSLLARLVQAWRCREPWLAVLLHPAGVLVAVVLQWRALLRHWRGRPAVWRGRSYATHG